VSVNLYSRKHKLHYLTFYHTAWESLANPGRESVCSSVWKFESWKGTNHQALIQIKQNQSKQHRKVFQRSCMY